MVEQMASMMAWLRNKGYQKRDSFGAEGTSWLVIISKVLIYVNKLLEINGWKYKLTVCKLCIHSLNSKSWSYT